MRVGIHNRLWVKNVCAIGLSAGFIEPLESNGLFSVHEFLRILLRNMKRGAVSQWDKDNFTHECKSTFKCFAEFVAMHYALSHRNDTPYWKSNLNKNWDKKLINLKPSSIAGIIWSSHQRQDWQFNETGGLHCIAAGMNWAPTDVDEVMFKNLMNEKVFIEDCKYTAKQLDDRKKNWDKIIKNKTSYYDYLKNEIYKN